MEEAGKALQDLLEVMARLRAPDGCPWDRVQSHKSIRFHAVEEVYELIDAIEADDESEMEEELGDLLLQVVFHCQLGNERGAFNFASVARRIVEKLIRRHPHVFEKQTTHTVEGVWTQWEKIKRAEKEGTRHERDSAIDGIPRHLPALARAEKLLKKARKANLLPSQEFPENTPPVDREELGRRLFELAGLAQAHGWKPEELLRTEISRQESNLRRLEAARRTL